jgi:hypothetical protein
MLPGIQPEKPKGTDPPEKTPAENSAGGTIRIAA